MEPETDSFDLLVYSADITVASRHKHLTPPLPR